MPNMGEFVNFPAVLRSSSPPMIHFLGAHVGRFLLVLLPLNVSDKMLSATSCFVLYGFCPSAKIRRTLLRIKLFFVMFVIRRTSRLSVS